MDQPNFPIVFFTIGVGCFKVWAKINTLFKEVYDWLITPSNPLNSFTELFKEKVYADSSVSDMIFQPFLRQQK